MAEEYHDDVHSLNELAYIMGLSASVVGLADTAPATTAHTDGPNDDSEDDVTEILPPSPQPPRYSTRSAGGGAAANTPASAGGSSSAGASAQHSGATTKHRRKVKGKGKAKAKAKGKRKRKGKKRLRWDSSSSSSDEDSGSDGGGGGGGGGGGVLSGLKHIAKVQWEVNDILMKKEAIVELGKSAEYSDCWNNGKLLKQATSTEAVGHMAQQSTYDKHHLTTAHDSFGGHFEKLLLSASETLSSKKIPLYVTSRLSATKSESNPNPAFDFWSKMTGTC